MSANLDQGHRTEALKSGIHQSIVPRAMIDLQHLKNGMSRRQPGRTWRLYESKNVTAAALCIIILNRLGISEKKKVVWSYIRVVQRRPNDSKPGPQRSQFEKSPTGRRISRKGGIVGDQVIE